MDHDHSMDLSVGRSLASLSLGGAGASGGGGFPKPGSRTPSSFHGSASGSVYTTRAPAAPRPPHPLPRLIQELARRPVPFLTTPDLVALAATCGSLHDAMHSDHDAWATLTFQGPFPFG
jgi:hypothetical protein